MRYLLRRILIRNQLADHLATISVLREADELDNRVCVFFKVNTLVLTECHPSRLAAARKDMMPCEQLLCRILLAKIGEVFPESSKALLFRAIVVQLLLQSSKSVV